MKKKQIALSLSEQLFKAFQEAKTETENECLNGVKLTNVAFLRYLLKYFLESKLPDMEKKMDLIEVKVEDLFESSAEMMKELEGK